MRLDEAISLARRQTGVLDRVALLSRQGGEVNFRSHDDDGAQGDFLIFSGYYRPFTVSEASLRWSALMGWTDAHVLADDWQVRTMPLAKMGPQVRRIVMQVRADRRLERSKAIRTARISKRNTHDDRSSK